MNFFLQQTPDVQPGRQKFARGTSTTHNNFLPNLEIELSADSVCPDTVTIGFWKITV